MIRAGDVSRDRLRRDASSCPRASYLVESRWARRSSGRLGGAIGRGRVVAQLVHFESLRADANGSGDRLPERLQAKFDDTIRALGGGYCCVDPEKRGAHMHFWYNLLWDTPHVDRMGQAVDQGEAVGAGGRAVRHALRNQHQRTVMREATTHIHTHLVALRASRALLGLASRLPAS